MPTWYILLLIFLAGWLGGTISHYSLTIHQIRRDLERQNLRRVTIRWDRWFKPTYIVESHDDITTPHHRNGAPQ